jgi:hypothetical protein
MLAVQHSVSRGASVQFQFGKPVDKLFTLSALLCALGIVFMGVSCSRETSIKTATENIYTFDTPKELQAALEAFSITCEGPCPESAGVLISIEAEAGKTSLMKTCSFSLVGRDIVLTNRHCLPASIATAGAACDGKIQVIFARDGAKEVHGCSKILSLPAEYSPYKIVQRDFAFIQLKTAPARTALSIRQEGVTDKEVLTALVATPDHSGTNPASRLQRVSCTTHMNSYIVPDFTNSKSPVITFKNCNIVSGNSGAPMVDSAGNIKAIAQSGANRDPDLKIDPSTFAGKYIELSRKNQFSEGTNAVCFDNAELGLSSTAGGCDPKTAPYSFNPESAGYDEAEENSYQAQQISNLEKNIPSLRFHYVAKSPTEAEKKAGIIGKFFIEPLCLRGSKTEIPWLRAFATPAGASQYPVSTPLQYTAANRLYVMGLDDDARYTLRRSVLSQKIVLALPVQSLSQGAKGPIVVKGTSAGGSSKAEAPATKVSYSLGFCEN